jgi:hypothetical protein
MQPTLAIVIFAIVCAVAALLPRAVAPISDRSLELALAGRIHRFSYFTFTLA